MTKQYLGDAVYMEDDRVYGGLILTTENGVEVTNRIVLEPEAIPYLLKYMVNTFGKETIPYLLKYIVNTFGKETINSIINSSEFGELSASKGMKGD